MRYSPVYTGKVFIILFPLQCEYNIKQNCNENKGNYPIRLNVLVLSSGTCSSWCHTQKSLG